MTISQDACELARRAHLTIEPLYVLGYNSLDAAAEYEALGIDGSQFYVGVRSAPMGMAAPEAVTAAFYNFSPQLIAAAIPSVWGVTTPEALHQARYARIDAHCRGTLGADVLTSPEMVEAAALAREAATSLRAEGRTLFAGHAALPWPEEPLLQLFHAQMLLREHRGDGHIAALVLADLDGLEALITHVTLDPYGFMERVSRSSRGWTDEEWAAGYERTRARGLTDADNKATDANKALRAEIERQTDAAAVAPYLALGVPRAERLVELVKPWSDALGQAMFRALTAQA